MHQLFCIVPMLVHWGGGGSAQVYVPAFINRWNCGTFECAPTGCCTMFPRPVTVGCARSRGAVSCSASAAWDVVKILARIKAALIIISAGADSA